MSCDDGVVGGEVVQYFFNIDCVASLFVTSYSWLVVMTREDESAALERKYLAYYFRM